MQFIRRVLKVQFVQNLFGAAAGAVIALVLYTAVQGAIGVVASVMPTTSHARAAEVGINTDSQAFQEFTQRIKEHKDQ